MDMRDVMKIKNHGFTLIEFIGVIAALAIIFIVSLPVLSQMLKSNEEQKYQNTLKDIYLATEQYVEANRSAFLPLENVGGEVTVDIGLLRGAGYIKGNLVNPKTNKKFLDSDTVKIKVNSDRTLSYTFQE